MFLPRLAGKFLPRLFLNLGAIFQARGQSALALACYREAARLKPADARSPFALGRLLLQQGEMESAAMAFREALEARPDYAEAQNNLGIALYEQGQVAEATHCYQAALRLKPDYAAAHNNLGNTHLSQGRAAEAEACFRRALDSDPNYAEAYSNLGLALKEQGRYQEAEQSLRQALQLKPGFAGALSNLGSALQSQGRTEEAVNAYQEALRLQPDLGEAHANLAIILGDASRLAQAVSYYEKLLRRNPNSPEAHNRLGVALQAQSRWDEANQHFEAALRERPDYAEACANLGNSYVSLADLEKALASYQQALSLGPNSGAHSSYAFYLNYSPGHEPGEVATEYKEWASKYAALPASAMLPHGNSRDPERKLKVGYVSPDFCRHSVAFFIEPVIRNHDRSRFEVFCYSNVARPDAVTERLRAAAENWREIRLKTKEQVSELIRSDGIDILVDLAGHTSGNRLLVFARKPAPVQATYLGHPNTSGLGTMDYRITDALADPPGLTEHYHTEQLVRLPRCFLAYAPPPGAPQVAPPPHLSKGHVTFGSFNNAAKINHRVIALWSKILHAVPGSRLLLKSFAFSSADTKSRFMEMFAREGIEPERIDLFNFIPEVSSHLELYREIDIALDTFPYNGTTTTCEALWMGVPVITLAGAAHVARVGVSLLSSVGLTDLIAESEDNYLARAVALANNPEYSQALRSSLRDRMQNSPLTDAAGFTRELENAYLEMWRRWCASAPAEIAAEMAQDE